MSLSYEQSEFLERTNLTAGSVESLVDYLTYANYRHNRRISPDVPVREWRLVYGDEAVSRMERRFQEDLRESNKELLEACKAFVTAIRNGFGFGCKRDELEKQQEAIKMMKAAIASAEKEKA